MARIRIDEEQVKRMMETLELTREQALEVLADDREVDKMSMTAVQGDLTEAQKQISKKMRETGVRQRKAKADKSEQQDEAKAKPKGPTIYQFEQKERKQDTTKEGMVAEIATFLAEKATFGAENVQITNPSKEIAFTLNGEAFSLTIVRHRTPKK